MISPYRVAAVQFEPRLFAKDANIAALLQLVEHAAADGAKLITTPEMGTTGYCWFDRDEVKSEVEAIPGPTTDAFAAIAQRHGCYIVLGMPEVYPDRAYRSQRSCRAAPQDPFLYFRTKMVGTRRSRSSGLRHRDRQDRFADLHGHSFYRDRACRRLTRRRHHLPHQQLAGGAHAGALLDQPRL
jgi:hypothetical protein